MYIHIRILDPSPQTHMPVDLACGIAMGPSWESSTGTARVQHGHSTATASAQHDKATLTVIHLFLFVLILRHNVQDASKSLVLIPDILSTLGFKENTLARCAVHGHGSTNDYISAAIGQTLIA